MGVAVVVRPTDPKEGPPTSLKFALPAEVVLEAVGAVPLVSIALHGQTSGAPSTTTRSMRYPYTSYWGWTMYPVVMDLVVDVLLKQ